MKTSHTTIFIFYVFLFRGLLFASSSPTRNFIDDVVEINETLSRNNFPKNFIFGAGSAAYQELQLRKAEDLALGIISLINNQDDVKLAKEMGLDSFRLSISWSRILPTGKISGGINQKGIQFYHDLIDELLANGIKPFVTIFHWDLPQALEEEYGGLLSPKIMHDFVEYANILFKEYGKKVQYWTTLNEPNLMAEYSYATGAHAPGRCSNYIGNCSAGDSATEPYIALHHLLLCHAATVNLYRRTYAHHKGMIGIVVATTMLIPINNIEENRSAALRALDFSFGWIFDPVVYGHYPRSMRSLVGNRLPKFTKKESNLLRQSFDFIGLNYYTTYYVISSSTSNKQNLSYTTDSHATTAMYKDGIPIGEPTPLSWLYLYPQGLQYLLNYMKVKYNNPVMYITENGMAQDNNGGLAKDPAVLHDIQRVRYHSSHLSTLLKCIKEGANVRGYFSWTWLDDFEWGSGYTLRFGLTFVDFDNDMKRYPKDSYYWFKDFLAKDSVADA